MSALCARTCSITTHTSPDPLLSLDTTAAAGRTNTQLLALQAYAYPHKTSISCCPARPFPRWHCCHSSEPEEATTMHMLPTCHLAGDLLHSLLEAYGVTCCVSAKLVTSTDLSIVKLHTQHNTPYDSRCDVGGILCSIGPSDRQCRQQEQCGHGTLLSSTAATRTEGNQYTSLPAAQAAFTDLLPYTHIATSDIPHS